MTSRTSIVYFAEITQEVETKIGYPFKNPGILWEALQARDAPGGYLRGRNLTDGNKRLAMLGDTALKLVLLNRWYREGHSRGKLILIQSENMLLIDAKDVAGEILSKIGCNANLSRIGRENGLHHYVNTPISLNNGVSRDMMTTAVGAILGAVYLDGGIDMVEQVMIRLELGIYDLRPF